MTIKFNEVTWYSKLGAVILFLIVVPVLTFYIGMKYQEVISLSSRAEVDPQNTKAKISNTQNTFNDVLNGSYTVGDIEVTFNDGIAEQDLDPGSISKLETRIFGKPIYADVTGDAQKDAIFFVVQESGGTGVFLYVVAAVKNGNGYIGTNSIFLGDRVAPQNINVTGGVIAVNYAVRKDSDPMSAQPSVSVTKYISVKNNMLVEN